MPNISVVIPCFNNAAYIGATVESVLAQTLAPCEILVVDDGSTDDSTKIVAKFPPPVRLIQRKHANRATAMNHGFAMAMGDLIGIVDGDDLWKPEFLERNVAAIEADPKAVMAYCPAVVINAQGKPATRTDGCMLPEDQVHNLLTKNYLCNSSVLVRADVVRAVGGYEAAFWPCDDYHLWLKIAFQGRIVFQPEPLACYRVHGGQVTRGRAAMFRQMLEAKTDFVSRHPDIVARLGRAAVRSATQDWFLDACRSELRRGNIQLALRMTGDFLRRYPWRLAGLGLWLACRLPWRLRRHWMSPVPLVPSPRVR